MRSWDVQWRAWIGFLFCFCLFCFCFCFVLFCFAICFVLFFCVSGVRVGKNLFTRIERPMKHALTQDLSQLPHKATEYFEEILGNLFTPGVSRYYCKIIVFCADVICITIFFPYYWYLCERPSRVFPHDVRILLTAWMCHRSGNMSVNKVLVSGNDTIPWLESD